MQQTTRVEQSFCIWPTLSEKVVMRVVEPRTLRQPVIVYSVVLRTSD